MGVLYQDEQVRVMGPYLDKGIGRRIVNIYEGGVRRTTTLARWKMERALGRKLTADEEVDHKDDDKLNDELSNLQILTPLENHRKAHGEPEMFRFTCPGCGIEAEKLMRLVKHNRKQGKPGPYCGRSCAGKVNARARVA